MMTEAVAERPTKKESPRFSEAEIHRALVEVAACSGNTQKAARHLAEDDDAPSVTQKTLWRWSRREMIDTYERIRAEALPKITAQATEQHMNLARRQMAVSLKAADLVAERLPDMEDKDLVNAMGKADIGSGIHTEKAQLLAGQPTQIVRKDATEVLRKLKSRGVVIEGEVLSEEDVTNPEA
jgi:hypothetical protein